VILSLLLSLSLIQNQSNGRREITLAWDAVEYATYYTLTVDDAGQINAGCCSVSVIVNRGWHIFSLTASNESGTSDATILKARIR
jgi:hypothetical protein